MAAPDLTTLALVKSHSGITVATDDTLIGQLITSVSSMFEGYCRRTLAQVLAVNTIYRAGTNDKVIVLDEWPNATPIVTEDSTALVNNTDYEIRDDRRLIRISGDDDIEWTGGGRVDVTVDEGYATVPADLDLACREQTLFAFHQTHPGGRRLGVSDRQAPTGTQETFTEYGLLPSVVTVLDRYRRRF